MSRYNLSYQMDEYVSDFGIIFKKQKVKIQGGAPGLQTFYQAREQYTCGDAKGFDFRHLKVLFSGGRELKYPVPNTADIAGMVTALKGEGALCIDLVGEYFSTVPPEYVGNPNFREEPYTNLPSRKTYKNYIFSYTSDTPTSLNGSRQSTKVAQDDPELISCAIGGMENPEQKTVLCASSGIMTPRHYITKARAIDSFNSENFRENKVVRQVFVSNPAALIAVAAGIAKCAECLGYQGESINNIHLLFD